MAHVARQQLGALQHHLDLVRTKPTHEAREGLRRASNVPRSTAADQPRDLEALLVAHATVHYAECRRHTRFRIERHAVVAHRVKLLADGAHHLAMAGKALLEAGSAFHVGDLEKMVKRQARVSQAGTKVCRAAIGG